MRVTVDARRYRVVAPVVLAALVATTLMALATQTAAEAARPAAASSGIVAPETTAAPLPRAALAPVTWKTAVVRARGVRQWIECAGSGPVTVVVIAGLHASHTMWSRVLPSFARTARTCIYDRPGLGGSPARTPHRTVDAGLHADELWALLAAMHLSTRLVVVAHSYGGLVARALVARHRSAVVGLMLVEGVAPFDRLSRYWHEGGDTVDTLLSSRAAAPMRLGSMPLVVESAQDPDRSYWGGPAYGSSASDIADWKAHQRAASTLSSDSDYVVVRHSAHVIEHDRPDAVIAGLRLLVAAARTHSHMPRCALGDYGAQPRCA